MQTVKFKRAARLRHLTSRASRLILGGQSDSGEVMKITWLGHSAVHLVLGGKDILIDTFFEGNSKYPEGYEDRLAKVDYLVLTHGHSDHIGDAARIGKKFGPTVIAQFEICQYLGSKGLEKFEPMNIGGTVRADGLSFTMVNAQHSSTIVEDGEIIPLGDPAGFIISDGKETVYHLGDTALFSDLALIQRLYAPTLGLVPIGDRFTMGPREAAIACNEFLDLRYVIPVHWGTFGLLTGTPEEFAPQVTRGEVLTPAPGETLELDLT